MKLISVDGTQDFYSIAVSAHGRLSYAEFPARGSVSKKLVSNIKIVIEDANIEPSQLDYLVANPGPGSFTGVRGAIAALQAIGVVLYKPVYGLCMLEAIAILNKHITSKFEKIIVIIKIDDVNAYIQTFDSTSHPTSIINRVRIGSFIPISEEYCNRHKAIVLSNNNIFRNNHIVEANANTLLSAFIHKLSNKMYLKEALPSYMY